MTETDHVLRDRFGGLWRADGEAVDQETGEEVPAVKKVNGSQIGLRLTKRSVSVHNGPLQPVLAAEQVMPPEARELAPRSEYVHVDRNGVQWTEVDHGMLTGCPGAGTGAPVTMAKVRVEAAFGPLVRQRRSGR